MTQGNPRVGGARTAVAAVMATTILLTAAPTAGAWTLGEFPLDFWNQPGPEENAKAQPANGTVGGRHVTFSYAGEDGLATDFAVGPDVFFSEIIFPSAFTVKKQGNHFLLEGANFAATVYDNPVGLVRFDASESVLALTPGPKATWGHGSAAIVDISVGDTQAYLRNATVRNGSIELNDGGIFKIATSSAAGSSGVRGSHDAALEKAISQGLVGAQVQVTKQSTEVLIYDAVSLAPLALRGGDYRFVVEGHLDEGRVFVVDLHPGVLSSDIVDIEFYSEMFGTLVPAPITSAASLEDVLLMEPAEGPEYWWTADPSGVHVFVSVPHFSVHAFDVLGVVEDVPPLIVYGVATGLAVVGIATLSLFVGRAARIEARYPRAPQSP